jgi:hypothetical protein
MSGIVKQVRELAKQPGINTGAVMTKGPQRTDAVDTRGWVEPINPGDELLPIRVCGGGLLARPAPLSRRVPGCLVEQPRGKCGGFFGGVDPAGVKPAQQRLQVLSGDSHRVRINPASRGSYYLSARSKPGSPV